MNGLIDDPIPNSKSIAGSRDRNSDYPPFDDCNDFRCIAAQSVKNGFTQNPPSKDEFLKNAAASNDDYFLVPRVVE